MTTFTDYINQSLKNVPDGKALYKFKQDMIAEMTSRANDLAGMGLKDDKVIRDLLISEYPDLKGDYLRLMKQKKEAAKKAKAAQMTVLGIIGYILCLVAVYLGISFISSAWNRSWLIMVGGVFAPVIIAAALLVKKSSGNRGAFTPLSRLMLFVAVMLTATFIFLCLIMLTNVGKAYLLFLVGVAGGLICDGLFAHVTKQRFAVLSYIFYIPAVAAIAYVLFCLMGVLSWHPGWIIIVASLIADVAVVMVKIKKNSDDIGEEADVWNAD